MVQKVCDRTILSAAFHKTVTQSDHLQSNKARDLLRYLVYRLYDQGRGQLMNAEITLAQTSIAKKLGISRQWIGELTKRLEETGWIRHSSEKLQDGTNGSTVWRIGGQLKRLIIALIKSPQRKTSIKADVKSSWHFSPLRRVKEVLRLQAKVQAKEDEPPTAAMLAKIPLLKTWLGRGKE